MVYIFVLRFPAQPLSGLVGESASPPMVTWYVYHGWNMIRSGGVYFYKVRFQHLRLSEESIVIHFILGGSPPNLCLFDIFIGGSEVVGNFTVNFCASWWIFSDQYPWGYLILSLFYRSPGRVLSGSCSSLSSLWWQGLRSSQIGLIFDGKRCTRKSSPCLLFLSSRDREWLEYLFSPYLLWASFVAVFPHCVRSVELNRFNRKNMVIWELLSPCDDRGLEVLR